VSDDMPARLSVGIIADENRWADLQIWHEVYTIGVK
jgi:hypothetical protein